MVNGGKLITSAGRDPGCSRGLVAGLSTCGCSVTLHTSRHLLILVEQSAESVVSSYVVDLGGCSLGEWT
jgi:hypothetical protein